MPKIIVRLRISCCTSMIYIFSLHIRKHYALRHFSLSLPQGSWQSTLLRFWDPKPEERFNYNERHLGSTPTMYQLPQGLNNISDNAARCKSWNKYLAWLQQQQQPLKMGELVNAIENNDVMKMFCAVLKLSRTTAAPQKNKKKECGLFQNVNGKRGSQIIQHTLEYAQLLSVCVCECLCKKAAINVIITAINDKWHSSPGSWSTNRWLNSNCALTFLILWHGRATCSLMAAAASCFLLCR